jgi:hypothetical protein
MREERKMIRIESCYRSGSCGSIRWVGSELELADVVTRALKANVTKLTITREAPPIEARLEV